MDGLTTFLFALALQAGYNTALVTLGAALLGVAAGATGSFVVLRKRALVSDAIAHATLPGIAIAFMLLVAFGTEGRWLPGLTVGAAASALLGVLVIQWIVRHTRLSEDAAIGAVLSVFFGAGVVLLTVVQVMDGGRQAGLEGFLLGATAGMLASEALTIAVAGVGVAAIVFMNRRAMTLTAFDPDYAAVQGVDVARTDLVSMGLALAVTVIGLKIVGLVLIVALLIIPPVIARFWTDRTDFLIWIAALAGGLSGYLGAALSASADALPTGPLIVLVAFGLFMASMLFAPRRGGIMMALRHHARRRGYAGDAMLNAHEVARWRAARVLMRDDPTLDLDDGLTPIATLLTEDQIAVLDAYLAETC